MISDGVHGGLVNYGPVADMVGRGVYPVLAPSTAQTPYVVYAQVEGNYDDGLDDDSTDGLDEVRYTLACVALTYLEAKTLAGHVREFFRNARQHNNVLGGKAVTKTRVEDERDEAEYIDDAGEVQLFATSVDVVIQYNPNPCG